MLYYSQGKGDTDEQVKTLKILKLEKSKSSRKVFDHDSSEASEKVQSKQIIKAENKTK